MKRGSVKKSDSKGILVHFPNDVIPAIDRGVQLDDSDRSKFIRKAVREKLARHGIKVRE